ncbi:MAG: hypothetical protein ABIN68_01575 [Sphingomicrobium sp.]
MLAPLVTLAFFTTIWLVGLVAAGLLGRSDKIIAALQGRSMLAVAPSIRQVAGRVSQRSRPSRMLRADPQLRAAA